MYCQRCGEGLVEGAGSCESCGNPVPAGAVSASQTGAQVKARIQDAWDTIKVLAVNPMGSLSKVMATYDEPRAVQVGLTMAGFYGLAVLLSLYLLGSRLGQLTGIYISMRDLPFGSIVTIVIMIAAPFAALTAASALLRRVLHGNGNVGGDIFTAAAALLPLAAACLAAAILGGANIEVILALVLFALAYTILILYEGCARVAQLPEAWAAAAVPVMLILAGWLTKVIVVVLW